MKSIMSVVGVLLIIYGIIALGYKGFTYTSREKIAEIGNIQVSADTQKHVYLSPTAGGISLLAGIVLVFVARMNRKD